MCISKIYTWVYPDGRTEQTHQPTLCGNSLNGQPCINYIVFQHPSQFLSYNKSTAPSTPLYRSGDDADESDRSIGSSNSKKKRSSGVYVNGQKVLDLNRREDHRERIVRVDPPERIVLVDECAFGPDPDIDIVAGHGLGGNPRNLPHDSPHAQRPITWSPSEASLRGVKCYEVPGTINSVPVNALPDWGSAVNAVSEDFARRHGLKIKATDTQPIRLLGGHIAESVGRIVGHFKFQGERHDYRRKFHVLRKSVYDMVLGRKFLDQTKTLTQFCHRIVQRVRPCVQKGRRLFLLDESPKERLRCTINGIDASAFPDTGSELMLVSGDFVRRNKLNVNRGNEYRRQVELIDGSTIHTDGMVLNAELQFDIPPMSSQELDYDQYLSFTAGLYSLTSRRAKVIRPKSTFICDFHVIEDLPCDIILSNEFIFQNQVFSRFESLFHSKQANTCSGGDSILDHGLLFMRIKSTRTSWFSRRPAPPESEINTIPLGGGSSWEERWEIEETRRNHSQLSITLLPEPQRSFEQRNESQRQTIWDKKNPRPLPATRFTSSNPSLRRRQVPRVPSPAVPHSTERSTSLITSSTPVSPDGFSQP
ncbi:hypothetical protein EDB80DRAFT_371765 [Ilyonectria destructans]|nr:hypothetical protein EDB80DRAFT_371765 [Ilyonectria destructans]